MALPVEQVKTRISTVGSLSSHRHCRGFTLVELMVVLGIFVLLLGFSFPMFKDIRFFSQPGTQSGKLSILIQDLKRKAVTNHQDHYLHMDIGTNKLWITKGSMDRTINDTMEETNDQDMMVSSDEIRNDHEIEKFLPIDETFTITGVEFDRDVSFEDQSIVLFFSKQGYSDFAIIQCTENDSAFTLKIEPFLFPVQVLQGHKSFERCN